MRLLAGALRLDRPVFDATGLTGLYDVTLDYPPDDPFGIFTALQEAGLKLEQGKHRVDLLVIDHAERPSENRLAGAIVRHAADQRTRAPGRVS